MPDSRIAWLDLARAVSIVLVVVYHVGVGVNDVLLGGPDRPGARWWLDVNMALVPLRMPLFFAVSGVLAASALQRPWSRVLRPRLYDLLWPYLLWSMFFALTGWPRYAAGDWDGFVLEELTGLLLVASPYWFIAALPIFFVLTRLGRARPRVLVAAALLAYLAAPFLEQALRGAEASPDLVYGVFQLTDNALWFVLGYVARGVILRLGARPRPALGLGLAAGFSLLALIVLRADLPTAALRALELGASVSGLIACAALLPALARWRGVARAGRYLGSRTLVIYLVHPLVINAVVIAWMSAEVDPAALGPWRDVLVVPAATVLAIAAALFLDTIVSRVGPRWLLKAPGGREKGNSAQAHRARS